MSIDQGADERRVAALLRRRGVGPDADRPMPPAEPAPEGPDWLDRLWDSLDADEQQPAAPARGGARLPDWWSAKTPLADGEPPPPEDDLVPLVDTGRVPAQADPRPDALPTPTPDAPDIADPGPDRSGSWWPATPGYWPRPHWPTIPAPVERVAVSPKTRAALYNLGAAGTGWLLGLTPTFGGWLADCGNQFSIGGALALGIGGSVVIAHVWDRRTRHWWPGLAWAARIPLASALLALGLYAPGTV